MINLEKVIMFDQEYLLKYKHLDNPSNYILREHQDAILKNNLVLCVNEKGDTEIIKNRYGKEGKVLTPWDINEIKKEAVKSDKESFSKLLDNYETEIENATFNFGNTVFRRLLVLSIFVITHIFFVENFLKTVILVTGFQLVVSFVTYLQAKTINEHKLLLTDLIKKDKK